jgi:peptide/nickel transport system substrate-binding protein
VCLLSVWLAGCFLALPGCARSPVSVPQDRVLTIGFGVSGTALSQALPTLVDILSAEPLVSVGWNGRTVPKLAVDWSWDHDGRTLIVRLRSGVFFHDGTPLTASAVVPELQRYLKDSGWDRVESIRADGDDRVVIELREPDAFLLAELSKAAIKTGTKREFGTGPFILKSREPELVFDSFSKYHLGAPAMSKAIVRKYDTQRASWAALLRGDVKVLWEISRDAVEFVETASRTQTFSFPRPYYLPIVFNLKHPILGRRLVRQAINEAIDRPTIVRTALNNRGQPADGPVWPYHWSYNPSAKSYTFNPDAAQLRLDAAGLPVLSPGGGRMPRRFAFKCYFWSEDALFERVALVVQKQLFEIGVDVEMVPATMANLVTRMTSGDFDSMLLPMVSGRSLEWTYLFWRSVSADKKAIIRSGYTAADSVLDRLRAANSDEETRIAVADLQRIMYDDPPAAFLVRPETARAVDESVTVPIDERGRDILGNLWQWKPRGASEARAR